MIYLQLNPLTNNTKMEIKNIFLHHIDVANSLITEIKVIEDSANLNTYIESLVKDILDNPNRRFYNWKDGDTEVKNSLDPLKEIGNESEKYALNNAKRLLEKESKAQEQVN